MGNCTKVPRTNSNNQIVGRANVPNAGNANLAARPRISGPDFIQANNVFGSPNLGAISSYQVPNVPRMQNNYPASNYPPAPANHYVNYPNQYNPNAPSPIYNQQGIMNYSISNVPLNGRPQQVGPPGVKQGKAITRFSRIIKDSISLEPAGNDQYWINFAYKANYKTHISFYFFAQENFDKSKNSHYYMFEKNSPNPHQNFNIEASENGNFTNMCKINIKNVPQKVLEFSDRCTYPIIIELHSRNEDSVQEVQILISYFKITKEHDTLTASIIKQIIKVNNDYKELLNIFGTSEGNQEAECLICLSDLRTIAVMPCRHVCFCENCVEEVKKNNKLDCPVCRSRITSFLNIKHS